MCVALYLVGVMAEDRPTESKIEKLNGANFQSWKFQIKLVLMERDLYGFIDGSEIRPLDTAQEGVRRKFKARSEKAYSLIAQSVETSLQIHVSGTTDPSEAWEILQGQFSFVSVAQIVRVTRKFYTASMSEGDDMMAHVTKMTGLAQELRELGEEISTQKFATAVLGSLPPSYETFITSLSARRADDLDWDSIKGSLHEEYIKRKESEKSRGVRPGDEALITRDRSSGQRHYRNNRGGTSNGPRNPTRNFDQNANGRSNQNNRSSSSQPTCYRCQEVGHIARYCQNPVAVTNGGVNNVEQGNIVQSVQNLSVDDVAFVASEEAAFSDPVGSNGNISGDWFIDSGATRHMTYQRDAFIDFKEFTEPKGVALGDNAVITVVGSGTVRLPIFDCRESSAIHVSLRNVLIVPELKKNLISVPTITESDAEVDVEVLFDKEKCVVRKDGQFLMNLGQKVESSRLYRANTKVEYANIVEASADLWHRRMGHLNKNYMNQLVNKSLATGIGISLKNVDSSQHDKCEPCILGKMRRSPVPKKSETKSTEKLQLLHTDLCGPVHVDSLGGSRYIFTVTDDFSRYKSVYFLKKKDEALSNFQHFVNQAENFTGNSVKSVRSDNGGEYVSKEFLQYCSEKGIHHETTNPYTPEQNGVSERLNRTLMESARTMLFHAKLPLSFWAEAVKCATYIWNRSPTSALANKTPHECWFGKKPDLSNIRVFGCISYVHVPKELRKKLDAKAEKCIFVGYPDGTKGFKLYNLTTKKFIRSRSVLFCEDKFHDFEGKLEEKDYITFFSPEEIVHEEEISSEEEEESEDDSLTYEEKFVKAAQKVEKCARERNQTGMKLLRPNLTSSPIIVLLHPSLLMSMNPSLSKMPWKIQTGCTLWNPKCLPYTTTKLGSWCHAPVERML